jgi:hypothetical protein
MPFYDTNFNRVLVSVSRPGEAARVYAYLRDWLNSVVVSEPDEHGRIDIAIDQQPNDAAAVGIREVLDREWQDRAEWIRVEPTNRPLQGL